MVSLKLTRVGNSVGVVLPRETLARLKLAAGDTVFLTESPDGFRLTPYDPDFGAQIAVAEKVLKRRRAAFGVRDLASLESVLARPQNADAYAEVPRHRK